MRARFAVLIGLAAACGGTAAEVPSTVAPAPLPDALIAMADAAATTRWLADGDDPWEVWICEVPADTIAPIYGRLALRLALEPASVAATLNEHVTPYFDTLSHGGYRPVFEAGGTVMMDSDDEPSACVADALDRASDDARGVIAVATAEHDVGQVGGFGTAGFPCVPASERCNAGTMERSVYVGASDFHPDWDDAPPMDLVQHEIGHAIGWPHSGYVEGAATPHQSALDLMSNSAAPRDVDADRRDGPDTLAINRIAAGWMPLDSVYSIGAAGGRAVLQPSASDDGVRVAVVAVDDITILTIEVLTADGFNAHLPASGVAVHRIELIDGIRVQTPLTGDAPFDALLRKGDALTSDGWTISVTDDGPWVVDVSATGEG